MNEKTKFDVSTAEPVHGLAHMRAPFPAHQISKLPKPTKKQTDDVKADFKKGIRCTVCGGWHHPQVVHLDYVGHAALTDRLLACDPEWNWEPIAATESGAPALDENGGMWIKLTVCGVTRLGYGHSDGKRGGDAVKETIGDALRNAAMRFGAALDLWHKGQLHDDAEEPQHNKQEDTRAEEVVRLRAISITRLSEAPDLKALQTVWLSLPADQKADPKIIEHKDDMKAAMQVETSPAGIDDEIPY